MPPGLDHLQKTASQQNPLPWFTDVRDANQVSNVKGHAEYYKAAADGTLPAVSWVMPYNGVGEHPHSGDISSALMATWFQAVPSRPPYHGVA